MNDTQCLPSLHLRNKHQLNSIIFARLVHSEFLNIINKSNNDFITDVHTKKNYEQIPFMLNSYTKCEAKSVLLRYILTNIFFIQQKKNNFKKMQEKNQTDDNISVLKQGSVYKSILTELYLQ